MEEEFERRREPAYRTYTGWTSALISYDIRTLQIPEFLDIVAEIKAFEFACR